MSNEAIAMQHSGVLQEAPPVRRGEQAARVIAFGLGAVFLWAAFWKAVDPRGTVAVFAYLVGVKGTATALAHGLVYFEIVLGAILLTGVALRWSLAICSGALAAFVAWLLWAAFAGVDLDCGCALVPGRGTDGVGVLDVVRTGILAMCALAAFALARGGLRMTPEAGRDAQG